MNLLLITIFIISILAGAEVDLFTPCLPELQKIFELSLYQAQSLVGINFIGYCISSLLVGILGDKFKRKTVLICSMVVFILASILCVFARNYSMLLLGRFLQGVGIAAPAILGFVIISDHYPLRKQSFLLGIFNAVVSFSMAFAPIIGSYVNYLFNWRANFVVLLCFGIITLLLASFVIPQSNGDTSVQFSPRAYLSLLKEKNLMLLVAGICFLAAPFWSFIAIAPILYIKDLGVSLQNFGYYQGAIAGAFAFMSIFIGKFSSVQSSIKMLFFSVLLYLAGIAMLLLASTTSLGTPLFITMSMIVVCVAGIYPLNTMYPISLQIMGNSKSRASALIQSLRLILTTIVINGISYSYNGTFSPIAVIFIAMIVIFLFLTMFIINKKLAYNTVDINI